MKGLETDAVVIVGVFLLVLVFALAAYIGLH